MAELNSAFNRVCKTFKFDKLNKHQQKAIELFINQKRDIVVNLPTGYGKSIIYQALPLIFDHVTNTSGHIAIVVSALLTLIEDTLRKYGISVVSLSHVKTEDEREQVEINGNFSIVYATPEGLLKNDRWRRRLSSRTYSLKLCQRQQSVH
jgi:superfamily II DNA helicase RecQ